VILLSHALRRRGDIQAISRWKPGRHSGCFAAGMRNRRLFPLVFASLLLGAACGTDESEEDPENPVPDPSGDCHDPATAGCVVASDKQRITAPAAPEADLEELAAGNTTFALDLYARLRSEPGNLFYSPYSVSSALAMTYAGARGETALQMAEALRFTLPTARLHPAFNALDLALESRGKGAEGQDGGGFRLNVANALWGQTGYPFETPFLDVLAENYGAGLRVVDFGGAPDTSRTIINKWVAERTEQRIQDLLPEGAITQDTRFVLTNAIYFNAAWASPFDKDSTAPRDFTRRDGTTLSVPMMAGSQETGYGEGDGFAALELPYDGYELSMLLVLPTDIDAFEAGLDKAKLDEVLSSPTRHIVDVQLPRFDIDATMDLIPPLTDLGMQAAFSSAADFSGITTKEGLLITTVVQKAFVSVDEAGTEAAAATGVVGGPTSVPEPATIHFDRPFLFFIRDRQTRTVLFVGRVDDPS
jgi:serpin B